MVLKKLVAYVAAAFAVAMVPAAAQAAVATLSYDGNVAGTAGGTPFDTALSVSGQLDADPSAPIPVFNYTDVKLGLPAFGVVDFALPDLQIGLLPSFPGASGPALLFVLPSFGPVAGFALDFTSLTNIGPNQVSINASLLGATPFTIGGTDINVTASTGIFTITSVPEAATWAMMIVGFGAIGGTLRRRSSRTVLA
ncbi:hypothetical protein SCH01S_10_00490 [Sphingomonas changbaiensis NBRC 104936]|uniref:Uncharacterized protein n=1 Tax=Sphingomonas changbaiensis NBRC 104936 TaxID=1219043 RepID=A0A0E9ML27_9SPHN|nr:PEPxxWA-CTERM sorting domain-containing protein [Sphingomonas changbaiensis]GAO38239.1 hypothetical protein SCH01S_10_00490 [Sphingomonas changbaiensis NBRC 104936]